MSDAASQAVGARPTLAHYDAMLWFFGILSVAAFVSAVLLWMRGAREAR